MRDERTADELREACMAVALAHCSRKAAPRWRARVSP
jgi:hypothetical protein